MDLQLRPQQIARLISNASIVIKVIKVETKVALRPEYRYELEILSIQSKSRVSISQLNLFLTVKNQIFWTMNFASATSQNLNLTLPPPPHRLLYIHRLHQRFKKQLHLNLPFPRKQQQIQQQSLLQIILQPAFHTLTRSIATSERAKMTRFFALKPGESLIHLFYEWIQL